MKEMKGLRRYWGLMLAESDHEPVVFNMKEPVKTPIHSFLCPPFIAYWYLGKELIGKEIIKPRRSRIDPPGLYDKLIEVPIELKGGEDDDGV